MDPTQSSSVHVVGGTVRYKSCSKCNHRPSLLLWCPILRPALNPPVLLYLRAWSCVCAGSRINDSISHHSCNVTPSALSVLFWTPLFVFDQKFKCQIAQSFHCNLIISVLLQLLRDSLSVWRQEESSFAADPFEHQQQQQQQQCEEQTKALYVPSVLVCYFLLHFFCAVCVFLCWIKFAAIQKRAILPLFSGF